MNMLVSYAYVENWPNNYLVNYKCICVSLTPYVSRLCQQHKLYVWFIPSLAYSHSSNMCTPSNVWHTRIRPICVHRRTYGILTFIQYVYTVERMAYSHSSNMCTPSNVWHTRMHPICVHCRKYGILAFIQYVYTVERMAQSLIYALIKDVKL